MRVCSIALVLAGCGRVGFQPQGLSDGRAGDGGADAPPVPATVCSVDRVPVSGIPAIADLAIAPTTSGFVALWTDAAGGVSGAILDVQRHLVMTRPIPGLATDIVGGVADAGSTFVVATDNNASTIMWRVPHDLSTAANTFQDSGGITGRDPFPSDDAHTERVYVEAQGTQLQLYNMTPDGSIALGSTFATTGPITSIAGCDGPGHAHAVWTETIGVASQCTAADLRWMSPTMPVVQYTVIVSNDCLTLRNDTGPLPADGMMVVWTSSAGTVEGSYLVAGGSVPGQLSTRGRAPRTRYDGTHQWVAWIDETAGDELRFATYDLATGALAPSPLPGWAPAGDEAFELVRSGNQVFLAVLSTDALSFLGLCP